MDKSYRETSRIAVASILCIVGAIVCILLFSLSVALPMEDIGHFVGATVLFLIAGFVLGVLALVVIAIRHRYLKGTIYAILAIILSAPPLFAVYAIGQSAERRQERGKANVGTYNLRLLGKELAKYAKDHDGYLPDANQWCDLLMEYNSSLTKNNFKHPRPDRLKLKGDCHFAFNKYLSGMRLADVSDDVILLFESDGEWNLNGTGKLLRRRYNEKGCVSVLYANQEMKNYW